MLEILKDFGKFAALPLMFLAVLGIFVILYNSFNLPSYDQILEVAKI